MGIMARAAAILVQWLVNVLALEGLLVMARVTASVPLGRQHVFLARTMGVVAGNTPLGSQGGMLDFQFKHIDHVFVTIEAEVVALTVENQFSDHPVSLVASLAVLFLEWFVSVLVFGWPFEVLVAIQTGLGLEGLGPGG
jgi:hypothetical protein